MSDYLYVPPDTRLIVLDLEPGQEIFVCNANTSDVKLVVRTSKDRLHMTGVFETE